MFSDVLSNEATFISKAFSGQIEFDAKMMERYMGQLDFCGQIDSGVGFEFSEVLYEIVFKKDSSRGFELQYDDRYYFNAGYHNDTGDAYVYKSSDPDVISVDENGLVYECPIKPFRASDKSLLNMLMR